MCVRIKFSRMRWGTRVSYSRDAVNRPVDLSTPFRLYCSLRVCAKFRRSDLKGDLYRLFT